MPNLVIVGAGPIGTAAALAAIEDGVVDAIAGVVDPDPTARDLLRRQTDGVGYAATADLPLAKPGDRAVVAFSSRADKVAPEIVRLVSNGYHVVTTCEELAWAERHIWEAMHTSARSDGRVIIVTGANPGFVMDRMPLLFATASRNVERIVVTRRVDTSKRREPLVAKTGRGLSAAEFGAGIDRGDLGHKGLAASARLLAHGLGWAHNDLKETVEPVMSGDVVSGIHHHLVIRSDHDRVIEFDLVMDWNVEDPGDSVTVEGDPPITVHLANGGYHGDRGTIAQIVDALGRCSEVVPGFYRPTDLPIRLT